MDIQLKLVAERLGTKGITIEVAPEVINYLGKEGYTPEYGARPLKRLIQSKILNPVAEFIISRKVENGGIVSVEVKNGQPVIELKKVNRPKHYKKRETVNAEK